MRVVIRRRGSQSDVSRRNRRLLVDHDGKVIPPHRIRVVGVSGAGKSRLAAQVSTLLSVPRLELDAVFWDVGWTYRPIEDALSLVDAFAAAHPSGWVVDGNWSSRIAGRLEPATAGGADLVVWLDHSRATVMRRIIRRTIRRGLLREELWHGNRERVSSWFRADPERNILRWAWVQYPVMQDRMTDRIAAGEPVLRLRTQREVDDWLESLSR